MTAVGGAAGYREHVNAWRHSVQRWWVEIVAGVLGVSGMIDAMAHPIAYEGVDKGEPEWLVVVMPLLLAAPLLFRRRFPLPAGLGVLLVGIVGSFLLTGEAIVDGFSGFIIILLAVVVIAARDMPSAILGLLVAYAGVVAINQNARDQAAGDYFFPALFFTIVWIGSQVFHLRGDRLREAEARAQDLASRREQEARRAVADERARIARELHDVVGHSVSVMTVQASAVRRVLLPDQERERQALLTVEETGRQALAEMRRMVGVLRRPEDSPSLAPQPSLEHVEAVVQRARDSGLDVELRFDGEPRQIAPGLDLTAYRIVQEGLTNVVKHAGASRADVVICFGDDEIELVVTDDGRGATNGDPQGGHGLVGMRERVGVYGGELEAGPAPGGGYRLRARLPLS